MSRRRRRNNNSKKPLPPRAQGLKKIKNTKEIHHRKKKVILKASNKNKIALKRNQKPKVSEDKEKTGIPEQVPLYDKVVKEQPDIPIAESKETAVSTPSEATLNDHNDESNDMADDEEGMLVIDENVEEEAAVDPNEEIERHDAEESELTNQIFVDENHNEPSAVKLSEEDMMGDPSAQNICTICNIVTDSSSSLTNHMKQHSITNNQVHQCLICSKSLSSASSLDRHMLVHSGERPFKCKLCDMSFTTNGNMHRHMRTHGEMDVQENSKTLLDLRKKDQPKSEISEDSSENVPAVPEAKLHCPVCGKGFMCEYGLQTHMDTHPNDPIMCQKCEVISVNYKAHIEHKCYSLNLKSPRKCYNGLQCGFQDLTFMDFTSEKFSLVSKSYCEQNVKRPTSAFHVFECKECTKAFPCGRALKLHQKTHDSEIGTFCASCQCDFAAASFLQLHQLKHRSAEHCHNYPLHDNSMLPLVKQKLHAGKEDFLALLNLQTKQSQLSFLKGLNSSKVKEDNFENMDYFVHGKVMKKESKCGEVDSSNNNNNDFADIQSIISLTSKANLIPSSHTSPIAIRSTSPMLASQLPKSPKVAESANLSPATPSKDDAQDNHDVPDVEAFIESHGIFCCKICSQKFRNSSALKRHSKLHVQRGSNYSCHICSYVSVDKSTLIRHLRTHNGERPFQCVICKYAFTTKANCERHVRKRHKKFGKAEIRSAMQYNPNMAHRGGADPTSPDISNSETVCKYCGVDFKFNRVLRHHLRSLHNSCNRKPFSCKICKFGFSTKNNCIRHVLKQHPNLKDKLRSVVIPNSQMPQMDTSELTSSNTDNSNSSTCNQPLKDPNQPLDLYCNEQEKPLNLQSDKNSHDASEAVIAAEGLVCLSEAPPLQEEPLDLAVHAIDLSVKPVSAVTQKPSSKPNTIFNAPPCLYKPVGLIDLTTSKSQAVAVPENKIQIAPLPINNCSKKADVQPKNETTANSPGQKQRSFTCIYCSAGFTLKSNMERHIKRKHPEFARPTRSRNFIPSIVTPSLQKQNSTTLSDKTRDALRNVLSSKVQQVPVYKNLAPETLSKLGTFKIVGSPDSFISPVKQAPGQKALVNLSLDLSSKTDTVAIVDLKNAQVPKPTENGNDETCSDLASVSSVICTANSPQFIQYLGKSSDIEKMEVCSPDDKNEPSTNMENSKGEPSVSCPFCERKFPWTSSLRRHILTHTGQKPFKCPKCSLWFTTKSNCERHLFRKHGHKGDLITRSVPDRPYKCNHCLTSTFSTQGNLRKHFYLKHWTKSYLGMNCKPNNMDKKNGDQTSPSEKVIKPSPSKLSVKTVSSVTTQEHSYSQTEKPGFGCNFCDNRFSKLAELRKHMVQHNRVMYMCYLCRKTFPDHQDCYNHFKTSHSLVYMKINSTDENVMKSMSEAIAEDISEVPSEDTIASVACMVCFQKMSSVESLQQHFKRHLTKEKKVDNKELSDPSLDSTASHSQSNSTNAPNSKKARLAKSGKVKNSLLYFFTQAPSSSTVKSNKSANSKIELVAPEEDSDLIQNLLGIHDSKIIDEMLVSADSAARLLGVKEV
ncbi:hypothetical protein JTE90_025845 [Oedothorax gibbosus]|uniref:C2H2-type domain-containing protein n=1 Tax=Oedothorax gibbosus TaxID=931172 RepID=A0AAV6UTR3_9ARAC|nr:hypothetical protein JTE90_025845 [Oedothorax gibbosus]